MRQVIITLITLLNCILSLQAQTPLDKELLQIEQDVFVLKTDSERAPLILKKFDLYTSNNNPSANALHEAKRINYELLPNDESKVHFLWNAAITANLNSERDYAEYYIDRYHQISNDSSMEYKLLAALINNGEDSAILVKLAADLSKRDTGFTCLTCLNDVAYYHKKGKNKYLVASAIIPGLGSILEGYPLKGTASLLVNAASAFAVYELVKSNLYVNAILWGITLTTKFYAGNIRLTNKLFTDKELKQKNTLATKCKGKLNGLLNKYPILFR